MTCTHKLPKLCSATLITEQVLSFFLSAVIIMINDNENKIMIIIINHLSAKKLEMNVRYNKELLAKKSGPGS